MMSDGIKSMAFLNPLERLAFQIAVKEKRAEFNAKELTVTLNYDLKPGKIWFSPKDGKNVVPCGWLDIKTVLEKAWVGT